MAKIKVKAYIKTPHAHQQRFIDAPVKRKVIRAGRRGGKTVGMGIYAAMRALRGARVLYAAPTADQTGSFWKEVTDTFRELITAKVVKKNETNHVLEFPASMGGGRIKAKTAWNADTLRGDYADLLILDEFQLMAEETWNEVGAPMLLDGDGDAVFIYTPPSLRTTGASKAKDPRFASKMFKRAARAYEAQQAQLEAESSGDKAALAAFTEDELLDAGRWEAFHFSSKENPYLVQAALNEISRDLSEHAYRQEILALDIEDDPRALWTTPVIVRQRIWRVDTDFARVVVGVDPPGGVTECGILVAAQGYDDNLYILEDASLNAEPSVWAKKVLEVYRRWRADLIVVEKNFGGDMVKETLENVTEGAKYNIDYVSASRGKAIRAEPVVAQYEHGIAFHVGEFPQLEIEMTNWVPNVGMKSPNRLDALVWAINELNSRTTLQRGTNLLEGYRG